MDLPKKFFHALSTWNVFPDEAIVQVKNIYGDSSIGPSNTFWWGYERDNPEGTIVKARRLDKPKKGKLNNDV